MSPAHEETRQHVVIRWDLDWDSPSEEGMEFRLTYAGPLYAQNTRESESKTAHKHDLRRHFHKQLKSIWEQHPNLIDYTSLREKFPNESMFVPFQQEGILWQPLVRGDTHSIVCRLDILMLRHGGKGGVLTDIDNRLKTLFDALQMVKRPEELPKGLDGKRIGPQPDETPFFVLLEDDKLITALTVETDTLLEPVVFPTDPFKTVPLENAVRLFISVTARPYRVHMDNLSLL